MSVPSTKPAKRPAKRPPRTLRIVLRSLWALGLLTLTFGPVESLIASYGSDLDHALPPRGLAHFEAMDAHFAEDFTGYGRLSVLVPPFGVILLSHSALGFLNVSSVSPELKGRACVALDRVAVRALDPRISAYRRDPREVQQLGEQNLYLTHLSLVLGARRVACRDEPYDALHTRINDHLRSQSLASPTAHAASYPGSAHFPADQAATLASLHLYDLGHDTQLSTEPVQAWLQSMSQPAHLAEHGLHRSSLSDWYPHSQHARGCALSWTAIYMPQFAPDEAHALYEVYREHYAVEVAGLGGFREYAPGIDAGMDADSGPILFGMGVAATGLGLGAARLHDDSETYQRILQTAATVGAPSVLRDERIYGLAPMLGEAILFHASTARRWDGTAVQSGPYESSLPWGTLVYLALLLLLIGRSVHAIARDSRGPSEVPPKPPPC